MLDRLTSGKREGGWLLQAANGLTRVVFAADCRICERLLLSSRPVPICEECLQSFTPLQGHLCETCGQPWSNWSLGPSRQSGDNEQDRVLCPECRTRAWGFDRARSFAAYKASLVRAIVLLKIEQIEPLGRRFADRLREIAARERIEADLVVPVPLHRQRQRERGDNQPALT